MSAQPTNGDEARQAAREAKEQLAEQRGKWGRVRRLVSSLEKLGEDNHFSEKMIEAFRSRS